MQPDIANALAEAANLLLVGMTVVFLFLTMLIGAIKLMSWANKFLPDESSSTVTTPQPKMHAGSQNSQAVSPKVVAAIGAAVRQYRRTH